MVGELGTFRKSVRLRYNQQGNEEDLDGLVIRLNNPKKPLFAYVPTSGDARHFDPTKDVIYVE